MTSVEALRSALIRHGLSDHDLVVGSSDDGGYVVFYKDARVTVHRNEDTVTVVVRGSRMTLPSPSLGDVSRTIAMAVSPTTVTYRDVSGRDLYVVRNTLGDKPPAIVVAATPVEAVEVTAKYYRRAPSSFAADMATPEDQGRFAQALMPNGRLYPIEQVFKALGATR